MQYVFCNICINTIEYLDDSSFGRDVARATQESLMSLLYS